MKPDGVKDEYSDDQYENDYGDEQSEGEYVNKDEEDEDLGDQGEDEDEEDELDDHDVEEVIKLCKYYKNDEWIGGHSLGKNRDEYEERSLMEGARLYKCLEHLNKSAGAFAYSASFSDAPNPGVSISNSGMLRLPVSLTEATKLYKFGEFNRLKALSVIPATELELRNDLWQSWLDNVVKRVGKAMGIDETMGLTVKLERLAIFKNVNRIKEDTCNVSDTERTVGTLEITLPGDFKGPENKTFFSYKGGLKDCSFSEESQFNTIVNSWYSDVTQNRVADFSGGYRVALVYSLMVRPAVFTQEKPSASKMEAPSRVFEALESFRNAHFPIAYVLREQYSNTEQKYMEFSRKGLILVQTLAQAVGRVDGISFYCGSLSTSNQRTKQTYKLLKDILQSPSHAFKDMIHLGGPQIELDDGYVFEWPILKFGERISGMHNDDEMGQDGNEREIDRHYQSSCVVLFPDSVIRRLRDDLETESPHDWKRVKSVMEAAGSPKEYERNQYGLELGRIILENCSGSNSGRCLSGYSDADISEAGIFLSKILKQLPSEVSLKTVAEYAIDSPEV
ncbi:hypothetical protein TWF694_002952 [Orbilia ellipsospora]|uniref:Uncharacterized protein n=1 Tax=Orbilia ellipsospora TaxID=2528407 RepID=A0AAV9X1J8_9PEZI